MSQSLPLTIEQAISKAKKASKQGNNSLALQLYSAVLARQPNHPVARKGFRKLQKSSLSKSQRVQKQATNPSREQLNALMNLYRSGQMEQAEKSCRELLQSYPQSIIIINVLGTVLQVQGKLKEAIAAFDRGIELDPESADAYSNRGNALKELAQLENTDKCYESAMASYDKAIKLKPKFVEALYNRGNALKDLGQLEEAVESYDRAIKLRPEFAQAHRNLSAIKSYQPNDTQIGLMENLYSDSQTPEADRVELCFALAKVFEDLREYDKCFNYLEEGNRLRKNELRYDPTVDKKLFANLKEIFREDQADADVVTDNKHPSVRPLFIVGMMRSGTSLVEQILASHSKVYGAGELEWLNQLVVPFLADPGISHDGNNISAAHIKSIRQSYIEKLAPLTVSENIVTDKMPLNFRWIGIILSAFPEAKVIHLERDPRATCWSIYKHYFPAEGNPYAYDLADLADYYKLYTDLMSFWHDRYPNIIFDISYEAMTENPEEEIRKLLTFCDLEWEAPCLEFHLTKRAVKTMSATQIRNKMYKGSSGAWRNFEKHLQPLIKALGD